MNATGLVDTTWSPLTCWRRTDELVCRRKSLDEVLSTVDTIILFRFAGRFAIGAWNGIYEAVEIRIAKVCNAVSSRMSFGLGRDWRFDNTVLCALDGVVGPSRKQVSCIDHDRVLYGRGVDKRVVW